MKNLIYFFVIIIAVKILLNSYYFLRLKKFYKIYKDYLVEANNYENLLENSNEINELFYRAGIQDAKFPYVQPIGYGQISAGHVSILNNIQLRREDVYIPIIGMFTKASGIYKRRINESINPIYWIETIIFLPKVLLGFLGVEKDKLLVKILQIIWWIIASLGSFIYSLNKFEFDQFIKNFIQSLIK